jgi:inosine/xanthosine triphosphate pyrophosphatase family protein
MSLRVVLVSPNWELREEIAQLFGGIEVANSRLGPAVPEGLDLVETARHRARESYAALGERCFVENVGLKIGDDPPRRGHDLKNELATGGIEAFARTHAGKRATAMVVVALADDQGIHVFAGEVDGVIVDPPRGDAKLGWDRAFIPDGYERTLAELGASKYLVNMRHAPYLDLADHLRGRRFGGAFEAHVTVRPPPDPAAFAASCDRLDVKCVMIELPVGERPAQPMTASVHRGELPEVQHEVHAIARALVADGFEVVRTKIEALPHNADIPESDEDAARTPANYFEYHLKLVLPDGADLAAIAAACEPHGARLSRNARTRRNATAEVGGDEERFVTLRVRSGRISANARFDALRAALEALPSVRVVKRISEYTVYDSDVGVDRGWL